MPKIMVLELCADDLMMGLQTVCEMLVSLKQNPGLLKVVPDDPAKIAITVLSQIVERNKREEGKTPEEDKIDEDKLEQSVRAAMDAMAKASGK
jgi:hypothetical protein